MGKRPNIVYILNDHQAFYGHETLDRTGPLRPNFKRFASEGIEFENAYCVSPMCGPARRSMLTGLYPHTHGQIHNENDPEYSHEVYLDNLAAGGYENYYFGKWHAGPGCAYDHHCEGFSETGYGNPYNSKEYDDYLKRNGLPRAEHRIERIFHRDVYDRKNYFPGLEEGRLYQCRDFWCGEHAIGVTVTPKETHEAFFLANMACEKLEELAKNRDREAPFTLRVDFWGPHQPFFPTQEYLDMYNPEDIEIYPSLYNDLHDKPYTLRQESNRPLGDGKNIIYPNPLPWSEWQKVLAHCYAHITMLDAAGGIIIDKIKELGLDDNTLIIWSTDHGDAIACQGGHFDKDSHMAQEVMRIPMAMCWKDRIEPGQKSDHLVFTCDIPATFADVSDCPFTNRIDGESLMKVVSLEEGKNEFWRDTLMCETYGHGYGVTILGRMVTDGRWKYVCTEKGQDELYDLKLDPYELKNLAVLPEYDRKKDEMRTALKKQQEKSEDSIPLEQLIV